MVNRLVSFLKNDSIQYVLMSAVASCVNMLSLVIFGRIFPVEEYAVVTTLQAFVSNAGAITTPLQIMLCKSLAENASTKVSQIHGQVSILLVTSGVQFIAMILVLFPLMKYLQLMNIIEYILFVILVLFNSLYIAITGVAQGKQDFALLGLMNITLYGVKMLLGVVLGLNGVGPMAVIIGFVIAEITCLLIMFHRLKAVLQEELGHFQFSIKAEFLRAYLWTFALYMIVSLYMNNGDLLIANFYCNKAEIGLYSVNITLAKIGVFLVATPVATVLLPKAATKSSDHAQQLRLLLMAEGVTLVLSFLCALVIYILREWAIVLLYGTNYTNAVQYTLSCLIFSVTLSVFWVFFQYVLTTNKMKHFTCITVLFGVFSTGSILLFKPSISWIPLIMAAAMCFTLGTSLFCKN